MERNNVGEIARNSLKLNFISPLAISRLNVQQNAGVCNEGIEYCGTSLIHQHTRTLIEQHICAARFIVFIWEITP